MRVTQLLIDAFGRIQEVVHEVVQDLTPQQLSWRANDNANSIAWLIWHLTRVQDDHIAEVAEMEQVWTAGNWYPQFNLPFSAAETGYAQKAKAVAAVQPKSGELLLGYHDAVYEQTIKYVSGLTASELDKIVDDVWDPPVTLGVRLVSVLSDDLQHAGQAAFIRGLALG